MNREEFNVKLQSLLDEMNSLGIKINRELLEIKISEYEAKVAEQLAKFYEELKYMNYEYVEPNSTKQLTKLLFEDLALTPPTLTKSGKPSLDKFALTVLAEQTPIAEYLLKYKSADRKKKMLENIKKALTSDNRIYPITHLNGAVSGRFTMDGGEAKVNPQQWPKDFRELVIPD